MVVYHTPYYYSHATVIFGQKIAIVAPKSTIPGSAGRIIGAISTKIDNLINKKDNQQH
jgi:hypothetical protein